MRVAILLVFCYHVASQPITEDPKRLPRELIECCPCPGSSRSQDLLRSRASDDCPCRGADSEGASSMLFPSAVRSDIPLMRSNDPKDDQKNLLEPEVGLATSMLQTLREATEEEYQDALARDAARSADAVPEESARNVVIVVKPRTHDDEEELISEASNVKETRCIQPLGSSLGRMRSPSKPIKVLPDIFRFPSKPGFMHKNLWDMDSNARASNVQENVVDMNGDTGNQSTPAFKLRTPLKENTLKSVGNILKTPSVIEKLELSLKNRPNLFERFNLPAIPKFNLDGPLRKASNNNNQNNDLNPALSNVEERTSNKGISREPLNLRNRPLMLKNLLKLKDVELIPKAIPKRPFLRSKSTKDLPISENIDINYNSEDSTYDSAMNEKVLLPKNVENTNFKSSALPSIDPDCGTDLDSEQAYQDPITSPSEIIPSIVDITETKMVESNETDDCDDVSLEEEASSPTKHMTPENEMVNSNETDDCDDVSLEEEASSPAKHMTPENKIVESNEADDYDIFSVDNEANSKNMPNEQIEFDNITKTIVEQIPVEIESNNEEEINRNNFDNENVSESIDLDSDTDSNIIGNIVSPTGNEKSTPFPQHEDVELDAIDSFDNSDECEEGANNRNAQYETPTVESSASVISNPLITKIQPLPALSESLFTFKENVKKTFENLKKTRNIDIHNIDKSYSVNENSGEDLDQDLKNEEPFDDTANAVPEDNVSLNKLTLEDLQKFSDDLLVLSSNNKQTFSPKTVEPDEQLSKFAVTDFKDLREPNSDTKQDIIKAEATSINPEDSLTFNKMKIEQENGCRSDFDSKIKHKTIQRAKSVTLDEKSQEMAVGASSPIASSLPVFLDPLNLNEKLGTPLIQKMDPLNMKEKLRSPLFEDLDPLNLNVHLKTPLQNIDPLNLSEKLRSSLHSVVQPTTPEDPLNLLGKPVNDVLKLPSLEGLRQRLSSVFETNDRSAEDGFSDEVGDNTDDAPVEMAPAASTINLRKLPSIKPLEDLNIDLFQLRPLSSAQPDFLSKAPSLSMNNFRAKLPIPNNLDLKPVKLESRVGNNKGVLGASLSFGLNKASHKEKLSKKPPNIHPLGNVLSSLPNLDELRNALHSGTQNLVGSSLQPNLDWLRNSNPIGDIDSIRRNAGKTMKSLQQRMKSTFKGGKISSPLAEKFARPQDLLEDVNDKLKAIHYDLNDRLSSIHEDFLDQAKLKPFGSRIPTLPTNRNSNSNVMTNFRKPKGKPVRLQTSASTLSSQELDPFDTADNINLQARSNSNRIHSNLHRNMDGAESAPVPAKVEFIKPRTPLDFAKKTMKPQSQLVPSLRQGTENIFPENIRTKPLPSLPRSSLIKDVKRPLLRKPSPFKDSKVTITFATTTARPVLTEKYRTPALKANRPISKPNSDLSDRLAAARSKLFSDTKSSPSETILRNAKDPVRIKNNFKTANSDLKNMPKPQILDPNDIKSRFSDFKERNKDFGRNENNAMIFNKPEVRNLEVTEQPKHLVWPKSTDNSFLAKVREAMQARLARFDSTRDRTTTRNIRPKHAKSEPKLTDVEKVGIPNDMVKAASEHNDVIFEEPLKENVSYRCKMVCTKE